MTSGLQTLWAQIRPADAEDRSTVVFLFLAGAVAEQALVVILNQTLVHHDKPGVVAVGAMPFVIAVLLWTWCDRLLVKRVTAYCAEAALRQTFEVVDGLRRAPLRSIEAVGQQAAVHAIAVDAQTVGNAGVAMVLAGRSITRILGGLLYGLSLTIQGAGLAGLVMLAVGVASWHQMHNLIAGMGRIFAAAASLRGLLGHLIEGLPAIRQHEGRRNALGVRWRASVDALGSTHLGVFRPFFVDSTLINLLYLSALALLAFALPAFTGLESGDLRTLSCVVLWASTGVFGIVFELPPVNEAVAALGRLEDWKRRVAREDAEPRSEAEGGLLGGRRLEHIGVRGLTFSYSPMAGRTTFSIGPVDVLLHAGELVLVAGANGAGKSTFVKALVGLYQADAGALLVNGEPLASTDRDRYRELFGYIPADVYLFDTVFGMTPDQEPRAQALLEKMEIDHKTSIVNGKITNRSLSTGQRQRLAMALTLLSDRPVLVFDEWAATQDPEHRALFYDVLLPELREQGKLVIVVSHDDRYFHLADRLIEFSGGQMIERRQAVQCP